MEEKSFYQSLKDFPEEAAKQYKEKGAKQGGENMTYLGKHFRIRRSAVKYGRRLARKYPNRIVHVVYDKHGAWVHSHTKWRPDEYTK